MFCIVWSHSLMLQIILQIIHPIPLRLLKMHDCYYCFLQYCYYFSGFQVNSSVVWCLSSNLRFHWQVIIPYSSISQVQTPSFIATLSHLRMIDLLAYNYTHQIIFSIISSEHSSLIFNFFRSEDVLREGLFFEGDWRHKD